MPGCKTCKDNNSCDVCNDKFFYDYSQKKCENCQNNCRECVNKTLCSKCDTNYFKKNISEETYICDECSDPGYLVYGGKL